MEVKYKQAFKLNKSNIDLQLLSRYIINSEEHKSELFSAIRTSRTVGMSRFNVWRLLLNLIPFEGTWNDKVTQLEQTRKRWISVKD
jgi:hypothetical protein